MDLYVLDGLLRRAEIIDKYVSLIWTERYSTCGDFELVIHSDRGIRELLTEGTLLAINESYRIMKVETVEKGVDSDDVAILNVSGRSLEALLDDRTAMSALASLTTTPKWEITGTPGNIVREIFQTICVEGDLSAGDVLPFYTAGSIFQAGSIAEPGDSIIVSLDLDSVYSSIKKICDIYDLGFRLVRNLDTSQLYFDVYTGDDHTTLQTIFAPVVFSPELDNLSGTSELTSIAQFKNVAYVFAPNGAVIIYGDNISPTITGFDRRVLTVKAEDITIAAGTELTAALIQRGKEELAKHRVIVAFDGEIPQFSSYKYGIHYNLGDLVEMRNADGMAMNMRVTEQIFVTDAQGERSYPTLSIDLLITPGSWYAWDAQQVWDDADEYWQDA